MLKLFSVTVSEEPLSRFSQPQPVSTYFTDFSGAFSTRFIQTVKVAAIPISFSSLNNGGLVKTLSKAM